MFIYQDDCLIWNTVGFNWKWCSDMIEILKLFFIEGKRLVQPLSPLLFLLKSQQQKYLLWKNEGLGEHKRIKKLKPFLKKNRDIYGK